MMRTTLRRMRKARQDDEGFSLIETIVAMSIFGVFTSLVMAAIIAMLTDTQKNQSLLDGQVTIENIFQKLDHSVRYANGVQQPGIGVGANASNYYVEWQSQPVTTQPATCTQLKFNPTTDILQLRTWSPTATVITPTAWKQIGADITNPGNPFQLTAANSKAVVPILHQQLQVTLMTQPHGTSSAKSTASVTEATFTALNSSSQTLNVCQEVSRS